MEEIWKDLPGFEGLYQVSNLGRIYSVPRYKAKGGIMSGHADKKGYINITLRRNGEQFTQKLHRLVAITFIPNPENLPEVNHKDENKQNNCVDNLEWCTTAYNHEYGTRTLRASTRCGKPIRCIETGVEYPGARWAARELNIDASSITKALKNPNRTCGGYHWQYVEA